MIDDGGVILIYYRYYLSTNCNQYSIASNTNY